MKKITVLAILTLLLGYSSFSQDFGAYIPISYNRAFPISNMKNSIKTGNGFTAGLGVHFYKRNYYGNKTHIIGIGRVSLNSGYIKFKEKAKINTNKIPINIIPITLNLEYQLPIPFPVVVGANVGTNISKEKYNNENSSHMRFTYGFSVSVTPLAIILPINVGVRYDHYSNFTYWSLFAGFYINTFRY